jgi:TIGR03943 family protein
MLTKKRTINPQIGLEFLCYTIFAALLIYLVITGKYQNYVAPKMVPYLYFTAAVMAVWALSCVFRIFRPQYKTHSAHCFILAIPILLLLLPHSPVSASNLSSGYLSGKAIANLSGQNIGTTAATDSSLSDGSTSPADDRSGSDLQADSANTQDQNDVPKDEYGNDLIGLDAENKTITVDNDCFYQWIAEIYTNLDKYTGYKISVTGFVYKDPETMKSNEFTPARLMMSCCVADLTPVGFICKYDSASSLADNKWVTVEGTIIKGEYMGDPEPQISVKKISPADEVDGYVYP